MEVKVFCKYDELVDPKQLKDYEKNPNKHSDDQIARLAKIYQFQGIRHPIIVDPDRGVIAAGHGRKQAAIFAGIEKVPVVYQKFESYEQFYAFVTSDNAIALWADLDLSGINMELADLGPDFDIDWLGLKNFSLDISEKELPHLEASEPGFQQVTFILSNEQKDILDEAMEKAKSEEDCEDELNQNRNGNILAAILKRYVHG